MMQTKLNFNALEEILEIIPFLKIVTIIETIFCLGKKLRMWENNCVCNALSHNGWFD